MPNFISRQKADTVIGLFRSGLSVRRVVAEVGVARNTAMRYRNLYLADILIKCTCGQNVKHKGWCSWRFSQSEKRQEWMRTRQASRPRVIRAPRPRFERIELAYPYLLNSQTEGADILMRINNAVPKTLHPDVRADVCQELILAYLSSEIDVERVADYVPDFIKRHYRQYPRKFGHVSLDAPMFGDEGGRTLAETLIG